MNNVEITAGYLKSLNVAPLKYAQCLYDMILTAVFKASR